MQVVGLGAGAGVTAIATGQFHSCAALAGGVRCWGDNSLQQLTDGTLTSRLSPVQSIPTGSGVTGLSAGGWLTCAIAAGGLNCWGYSNYAAFSGQSQAVLPVGSNVSKITTYGLGLRHTF